MMENGVYRLSAQPGESMPTLDGRELGDKSRLLAALADVLHFPDYFGGNWDALDECLADLSWHDGPFKLLITDAAQLPQALRDNLIDIFLDAARLSAETGRPFALYLA